MQASANKYAQIIKTSTLADLHLLGDCTCVFSRRRQSDLLPNCLGTTFSILDIKVDEQLYLRLPSGVNLNFNFLLFNIFTSGTYLTIIFLTVGGENRTDDNDQDYGWKVWIYVPMHLYDFFSFFYAIRFTAKAIAAIENNKNVDIAYYGTYMAGLFLPNWNLVDSTKNK